MVKKKGPVRKKNVRKKAVRKNTNVYSYKSSSESDDASSLPPTQKYPIPTKAKITFIPPSDLSSILKVDTYLNEDDDLDEFDRPLHSTALEEEQHEMSAQSQEISPPKKRLEKRRNLKSNKNTDLKVKKSTKNSEKENVQNDAVRKTTLGMPANQVEPGTSFPLKSIRKTPENKQLHDVSPSPQDEGVVHTSGNVLQSSKTLVETSANLVVPVPSLTLKSGRTTPKSKRLQNASSGPQDEAVAHTSGNVGRGAKKSKKTVTLLEPSLAPSVINAARKAPKRKELSKAGPGFMDDKVTTAQEFQSATSASSLNSPERLDELSSPDPTEKVAEQSEVPKGKKRKVVHENILNHSNRDIACAGNVSVAIWCPDGTQRSSRDITELDIILAEFTNIVTSYKREVESVACIKAIDSFFSAVKEQLTETIEEVQKLKNLQRKNTKVNTGIAKTRKRLITVKDELLVTEPHLKQLQKEYVQLQDKMDSLKIATQFLTDLKELKKEYVEYRKKNPKEMEKYGVSSLPALLLESRSILSAEKHLHTINSKLQHFLDQDNATTPSD